MDFIAIDFETANHYRTSACSIGIAMVKNNQVMDSKHFFIKPEPFYFDPFNVMIHGITEDDVIDAPTFVELWPTLETLIDKQIIVAHNASFDISVMRRTLEQYNLPNPNISILCTYRIILEPSVYIGSSYSRHRTPDKSYFT